MDKLRIERFEQTHPFPLGSVKISELHLMKGYLGVPFYKIIHSLTHFIITNEGLYTGERGG